MALRDRIAALLGISTYENAPESGGWSGYGLDLSDNEVQEIRRRVGGNLTPQPTTRIRWYLSDLESAAASADSGDLASAAQLYRAMRRDGVVSGLLESLTSGLVRLPKRFYGIQDICNDLRARNGSRSIFDDMFPPSELALLAADGYMLGVGVGELRPVEGRDYPVFVRLEPEFLRWRWVEGRWYYNSIAGPLAIEPGNGWILHTPGGRVAPWMHAKWPSVGRAFINKEHAFLHRSNYSAKLANPARAATAPLGATEAQRRGFIANLIAWGVNTVFELPIGWDVKLIESNGRGIEVFQEEIDACNNELMIALAGQIVTTEGGTGFANADIHRAIRADIIQYVGESLAYTLNTQGLPQYVLNHAAGGEEALATGATVEWDTKQPRDLKDQASVMQQLGTGLPLLAQAIAGAGLQIDYVELATQYGIPIIGAPDTGSGTAEATADETGDTHDEAFSDDEDLALDDEPANDAEAA